MGVELIIIGIVAGASVLISGISAVTSIGTIFFFKKKFKSSESAESTDTTNVIIENEAIKEEHADGSSKTTRKQKIKITDIDNEIGQKIISGSTTMTRTGLPNETAETLAKGGVGALNKLTAGVIPQVGGLIEEASEAEVGFHFLKEGMKLIEEETESETETETESETETTEKTVIKVDNVGVVSKQEDDSDDSWGTKQPKAKKQEVLKVSNIIKVAMGDGSEESSDHDAVVFAEQVVLGETTAELSEV